MTGGAGRVVVLTGLPGSGKSTVGALVARRLGWRFVDLDAEIERSAGMPVADIFASRGEAAFRRLEHEMTARIAVTGRMVLAPGGGWSLDPSNAALFGKRALTVYLRVSPEVAVDRMRSGVARRPLLAGPDPLDALRRLLEVREAAYLQADHTLAVDRLAAGQVADTIVALATDHIAD